MRRRLSVAAVFLVLGGSATVILATGGASGQPGRLPGAVIGHSVRGRALTAVRLGDPASARKVLVVGVIHGDEDAGALIVRKLRRGSRGLQGVDLWTVLSINPDGKAAGTRQNARGIDLNRNFSYRWSGAEPAGSGYYGGPHPFSEPESRALRSLISRIRPDLTIYYHQPWGHVLAPCHGDARLERRYSKISGIPLERCRGEHLPGTATSWQEHRFPKTSAFVVEFGAGGLSDREAARNARAVARLARGGAGHLGRVAQGSLAAIKPKIHDMLIPFGPRRKREMAAYSKRHYGQYEWRLRQVKLIVEHLSVTPDVRSVFNTFAPDVPDVEFGELPGVCSHYVIGRSGRVYRFVPLGIRCRHVVGLNYLSVGIEHVGSTESDVLRNPRQLHASLRLTRWLSCRFGLPVSGVIGHNESLSSPYYRELDPRFRGQTHGDWRPPYMRRYRRMLRARGPCPGT